MTACLALIVVLLTAHLGWDIYKFLVNQRKLEKPKQENSEYVQVPEQEKEQEKEKESEEHLKAMYGLAQNIQKTWLNLTNEDENDER